MKNITIKKLVLSAMFLSIGLVLPLLTGQIRYIGNMLLPMHIPVLLCGLICGYKWGFAVGAVLPLLRSAIFGKPAIFPNAAAMAFELAAYGAVIGFVFMRSKKRNMLSVYVSLVAAMISGRALWALAETVILGIWFDGFTLELFYTNAFLTAIPGIILQLVLIPAVMFALQKSRLVCFESRDILCKN